MIALLWRTEHCAFSALNATVVMLLVTAIQIVQSQPVHVGVKGAYLQVVNASSVPVLLGSVDCGTFQDGISPGVLAGLTVDYALLDAQLEIAASLVYQQRPAQLRATSVDDYTVLDPRTSSYVNLVREHVFTSQLGYFGIEIGLRSRPVIGLPFYGRASVDVGNPIVNATYQQTEEIMSPPGVLFPDGTKRRIVGNGEFPGLGTSLGAYAGIGATFGLTDRVEFCPEVGYRVGLNSVSSRSQWQQSWWSAGAQIRVRLGGSDGTTLREPDPVPPPEAAPTITPVPLSVTEQTAPVQLASIAGAPLEIQQTMVTQTFPLLPYIFFDSASAALPERYVQTKSIERFREADVAKSTLPIYYAILDIVGQRMAADQSIRITVIGATDGREEPRVGDRQTLARERASVVVSYLTTKWKIAPERCSIVVRNVPRFESNTDYAEGLAENRRVELVASISSALGPVVHRRFFEYVPVQPRQVLGVSLADTLTVRAWQLQIGVPSAAPAIVKQGNGHPTTTVEVDLDSVALQRLGPDLDKIDSLTATLLITSENGDTLRAVAHFPVVTTTSTFEVSRLSLIVFEYDDASISGPNAAMMTEVISTAIGPGSRARIIGSTDRLGELDHNVELSNQRARSVQALASRIAPTLVIDDVRGVGPGSLPYDNALPEGRFYCRTVSLTITTPLR